MSKLIHSMTGTTGTLEVFDNKIVVTKSNFMRSIDKGNMTLYYKNIVAIDYKEPTSMNKGYIRFVLPGSDYKKSLAEVMNDDASIFFGKKDYKKSKEIMAYVESKINKTDFKLNSSNITDELLKLKTLLDSGAITSDEFDKLKNELMNSENSNSTYEPDSLSEPTSFNTQVTKPQKSKFRFVVAAFILFVGFSIALSGLKNTASKLSPSKNIVQQNSDINPVINAYDYYNMHLEDIKNIFGELKDNGYLNYEGLDANVYGVEDGTKDFVFTNSDNLLREVWLYPPEETTTIESINDLALLIGVEPSKKITAIAPLKIANVDKEKQIKYIKFTTSDSDFPKKIGILQFVYNY